MWDWGSKAAEEELDLEVPCCFVSTRFTVQGLREHVFLQSPSSGCKKKDCGGGAAGNGTCFVQQVFSEGTRLTLHTSGPCQSLLNAFFAARIG